MTTSVTSVDQLLELVKNIDRQSIAFEQKKLRAIRDWAMERIGVDYVVGDRVEIAKLFVSRSQTPGWWHYREALAPGAKAVVEDIDFNTVSKVWVSAIRLDREWSVSEAMGPRGVVRYWNGRVDETPEGMRPPSPHIQEAYPDGRQHVFHVWADHLRKYHEPAPQPCQACAR